MGFGQFGQWRLEERQAEATLHSPEILSAVPFDELVVSWNADPSVLMAVEAEAGREGKWRGPYPLGRWTGGSRPAERTSLKSQGDGFGRVSTDTLVLREKARKVRLRIRFPMGSADAGALRFVGLSFADSDVAGSPASPDREAWGRELAVPRRCQMHYQGGRAWCSPTTVAMCLEYWAGLLSRPDLARTVPEAAAQVFDPGWDGTGNWSFNAAWAGSFRGMRAVVARLGGVADLESLIRSGIPVPVSVSYNLLKGGVRKPGDGHLVVCTGFDAGGDVVVNDPAVDPQVRKVYPREDFARGWNSSVNTAYLIWPEDRALPADLSLSWDLR